MYQIYRFQIFTNKKIRILTRTLLSCAYSYAICMTNVHCQDLDPIKKSMKYFEEYWSYHKKQIMKHTNFNTIDYHSPRRTMLISSCWNYCLYIKILLITQKISNFPSRHKVTFICDRKMDYSGRTSDLFMIRQVTVSNFFKNIHCTYLLSC